MVRGGEREALVVDDPAREHAYEAAGSGAARARGWTLVSMANDFAYVFPFEVPVVESTDEGESER